WLGFALYGVYYALTDGVARALVADLVVQEGRGTAYGLYHAVVGLMAFPASLLAGILWQGLGSWPGFGASAPFYFGAAMALPAGLLLVWLRPGETGISRHAA
ncbi:MAG: MFS transporter, partial [Anaerolineales bacterium]